VIVTVSQTMPSPLPKHPAGAPAVGSAWIVTDAAREALEPASVTIIRARQTQPQVEADPPPFRGGAPISEDRGEGTVCGRRRLVRRSWAAPRSSAHPLSPCPHTLTRAEVTAHTACSPKTSCTRTGDGLGLGQVPRMVWVTVTIFPRHPPQGQPTAAPGTGVFGGAHQAFQERHVYDSYTHTYEVLVVFSLTVYATTTLVYRTTEYEVITVYGLRNASPYSRYAQARICRMRHTS
jgi:hypothetical protein